MNRPDTPDAGEPRKQFPTGAVRGTDLDSARYDLIPLVGLRRVAETAAYGAKKYGAGNWLKGLPSSDLLNHALAHISRYIDGDRSEDHLAHAAWNLMACCHNEERRPDMHDLAALAQQYLCSNCGQPFPCACNLTAYVNLLEPERVDSRSPAFPARVMAALDSLGICPETWYVDGTPLAVGIRVDGCDYEIYEDDPLDPPRLVRLVKGDPPGSIDPEELQTKLIASGLWPGRWPAAEPGDIATVLPSAPGDGHQVRSGGEENLKGAAKAEFAYLEGMESVAGTSDSLPPGLRAVMGLIREVIGPEPSCSPGPTGSDEPFCDYCSGPHEGWDCPEGRGP